MTLRESAAAKVNLTLEVRGKRPDGYHELESIVFFASFGDELSFTPAPATPLSSAASLTTDATRASGKVLHVDGPFAEACAQGGATNLVAVAAGAFARFTGHPASGAFTLTKRIPVAAGLGGGSADAAAALRLLVRASAGETGIAKTQAAETAQRPDMAAYIPLAREIGADVPVCLFSRAAMMTGVGERLRHLAPIAPVPAVLVNPMVPLATRDVFRELQAPSLPRSCEPTPDGMRTPPEFANFDDMLAYARTHPNHLEAPAQRLLPAIGDVLSELANAPGAELARLSGSGPTCFALFRDNAAASAAAEVIAGAHPGWWVCATTLQ